MVLRHIEKTFKCYIVESAEGKKVGHQFLVGTKPLVSPCMDRWSKVKECGGRMVDEGGGTRGSKASDTRGWWRKAEQLWNGGWRVSALH